MWNQIYVISLETDFYFYFFIHFYAEKRMLLLLVVLSRNESAAKHCRLEQVGSLMC